MSTNEFVVCVGWRQKWKIHDLPSKFDFMRAKPKKKLQTKPSFISYHRFPYHLRITENNRILAKNDFNEVFFSDVQMFQF